MKTALIVWGLIFGGVSLGAISAYYYDDISTGDLLSELASWVLLGGGIVIGVLFAMNKSRVKQKTAIQ